MPVVIRGDGRPSDSDGTANNCLTNFDDLVLLHRPPALSIPDMPQVEAIPQTETEDDLPPSSETVVRNAAVWSRLNASWQPCNVSRFHCGTCLSGWRP
jgi:hypothetical protein